jgi:hypothetical protein
MVRLFIDLDLALAVVFAVASIWVFQRGLTALGRLLLGLSISAALPACFGIAYWTLF